MHEFELETAKLGPIVCSAYSLEAAATAEKLLKNDDLTGAALARGLLEHVGRLKREEEGKNDKRDRLTQEQIQSITEIEEFAREFLAHNAFLAKAGEGDETAADTSPEEKGAGENPEVEEPSGGQQPDASNSEYLLRIVRAYNEVQMARMKKLLEPLASIFFNRLFSDPTRDLLRENFALSDRLRNSLADSARQRGSVQPRSDLGLRLEDREDHACYVASWLKVLKDDFVHLFADRFYGNAFKWRTGRPALTACAACAMALVSIP